jgi:hypothetical protein
MIFIIITYNYHILQIIIIMILYTSILFRWEVLQKDKKV